ncbi:MAG: OmpA family protein [Chitinophagales bacterium]|nr:OmpA family protein [Chitinophagales bacterium]MDW8417856.1 OmpA family protein [Chitinophagales bacterium]
MRFGLNLIGVLVLLTSLSSCLVTKKKFDEQVALADKLRSERDDCRQKLNEAQATVEDLKNQIASLSNEVDRLKNANLSLEEKLRKANRLKEESDALCEKVKQQLEALSNSSASEKDKLLKQLAEKEKELLAKAEELNKLSAALSERDKKVRDLEALIAKKDEAVQTLKKRMLDALKGFSDAGELSVYEKDGKVYVALSDKLLFATGSYAVEPRGKEALKKIADVLNRQPDISIMVEGHTDNKPYVSSSGPINSNWDLSVMRASSVTKILVGENKVDPKRVTPAGRGEYFPVESNDTPEGRSKNRRIDIILTPDMKGIFDILNNAN